MAAYVGMPALLGARRRLAAFIHGGSYAGIAPGSEC